VLNPSEPIFLRCIKRKMIPARGSPNTPKIIKGRPKARDQMICESFQHLTVRSLLRSCSVSMVLQLKRLIIFDEVLE